MHDAGRRDLMRAKPRERATVEPYLPLTWMQQPADRTQRGGLSRTVAAHQRDDLPFLDCERNALDASILS